MVLVAITRHENWNEYKYKELNINNIIQAKPPTK